MTTVVKFFPFYRIHEGKLDTFRQICEWIVKKTKEEPKCLYYGFSFDDDEANCREG